MPNDFAESADGVVLIANGIDPMLRWDGFATQAEAAGVEAPDPDTTPVLAGSGVGSITGTYGVYVRFIDARGQPGNLSAASATVAVTNAGGFDYSNLPVPTSGKVASRQILRNTAGQLNTFYVDVEDDNVFDTTASGTKTDAQLQASTAVVLLDPDTGLAVGNRYGVPPDTKPFICFHLSRMWAAGEAAYTEGSIAVTQFSAAVSGVGTDWQENWAGRFLYVRGATKAYEIDAVDPAAQTLTLVEPYTDATDTFAEYAIKPSPGEASVLYFSEPGLPEAWPFYNGLSIPEDGDQVTGLLQFSSFLWIFKRRRTYRLTGQANPLDDAFIYHALNRGAVNHRCYVVVEEVLYVLDEGGVYRTGGGDAAEQVSTPIQNLFRPGAGGINWAASRYFHAVYDPVGETIRWFVAMEGDYLPRHALAYHPQGGKWWVEDWPVPVGSSCLGRAGRPTGSWTAERATVFLGGPAGEFLALGGELDGVPAAGATTRGTVTAAGVDTLTDATADFDPLAVNVPVCVVAGRGAGQRRLVVAATTTRLTVDEPWAVLPDTTSQYQVGGIPFRFVSGRLRWAPGDAQQGRSIEVQFVPTEAPQTFTLRVYSDFAATPRAIGQRVTAAHRRTATAEKGDGGYEVKLDSPNGFHWQRYDGHREGSIDTAPRMFKVEIEGVSGPEQVRFGETVLTGAAR